MSQHQVTSKAGNPSSMGRTKTVSQLLQRTSGFPAAAHLSWETYCSISFRHHLRVNHESPLKTWVSWVFPNTSDRERPPPWGPPGAPVVVTVARPEVTTPHAMGIKAIRMCLRRHEQGRSLTQIFLLSLHSNSARLASLPASSNKRPTLRGMTKVSLHPLGQSATEPVTKPSSRRPTLPS